MILDSQKVSDFCFSKWQIRVVIFHLRRKPVNIGTICFHIWWTPVESWNPPNIDSNLSIILSWFVSLLILRTNVFFFDIEYNRYLPKIINTWNSKTIDNQWWFSHPQENERGKEKIHYAIKDILYMISTTSVRKIKWKRAHSILCFKLMSSLVKLKNHWK